ncbi:MAG TPA: oxidoreductase [Actinomycetota bacterium]|nr:oxidoreductase [Actinomycetota bacterium]
MEGSASQFLADRAREGRPIRVGLVGVGQMGAGIVAQSSHIGGLEIVALADVDTSRVLRAVDHTGAPAPAEIDDPDKAAQVIDEGGSVVTAHAEMLPTLPLDVVVEATGIPEVGARVGLAAAMARTHLVSMNVEADVTIGRLLRRLFENSGCIYTLATGDEPIAAAELVDFSRTIGLEVIVAGKGKNNPLRQDATPASVADEARSKNMNPRMLAAFVDGSKTMVEMAALANAIGFVPDIPGMHGPRANAADLTSVFRPKADGGILTRTGVVDYVTGDVAPGVFAVVRSEDPEIIADLKYLSMGDGPYFALIRPYHLANLEVPVTIVRVVRDGRPALVPDGHHAEVGATAKRDLEPGDVIEGIGGDEVYGFTWSATEASERGLVPLGLTEGARVSSRVSRGQPLTFDDVEIDESKTLTRAWRMQQSVDELSTR